MLTRTAAVAGQFYPADPASLNQKLDEFLRASETDSLGQIQPKALIVPHAGYIYSGLTAAIAYQTLIPFKDNINRVVLLGPSHRMAFYGMATASASLFSTPLGNIAVDRLAIESMKKQHYFSELDEAHRWEHSLEVQLPFLQKVLGNFELIPLAAGHCPPDEASHCLKHLWGDEHTLIVISTDLSHFHPYLEAQAIDQATCMRILQKDTQIVASQACGYCGLNGLLHTIQGRKYRIELLDYCNSGDTSGDMKRVVGYGAFAIYPDQQSHEFS